MVTIFVTGGNFYAVKGITRGLFKLQAVTQEFVEKEILKLSPNKSTRLDGIPAHFVKEITPNPYH